MVVVALGKFYQLLRLDLSHCDLTASMIQQILEASKSKQPLCQLTIDYVHGNDAVLVAPSQQPPTMNLTIDVRIHLFDIK